ncbi:terminase [Hahella ganghwensis]|uniref:terminase n=1 Tax=Hahella ganghwensis TaxID=286420 RepID=UPI001FDFC75E|nr:terminase [Hahella ganghwensis]
MMNRAQEVKQADHYIRLYDAKKLPEDDLLRAVALKWFRLNVLYKVKNKVGKIVRFRPNYAQRERYIRGHNRNIILKARQLGFTTFEMIDSLDDCLFIDNFAAGCIAHTLTDATDIFTNKIKLAYDRLARSKVWQNIFDMMGLLFPVPVEDTTSSYRFSNGSTIKVSTSYRGGTLQRLHVSEFGKICRKFPDKAKEIVTGAFEAVPLDGVLTLESTAEGQEGYFFEYCQTAENLELSDSKLTPLDFKFHFFPWWGNSDYRMDPDGVVIGEQLKEYFDGLESEKGIELDDHQKAWYAKKSEVLQEDMKREYPSTAKEAFEQSVEGAYYARQMRQMRQMRQIRQRGQIRTLPYDERLPVFTFWDLGRNDSTSIWFMQYAHGQYRLIRYYENSGESIQFYLRKLREFDYLYSTIYLPHDAEVVDLTRGDNKSRREIVEDAGFRVEVVPRVPDKLEAIQAVRDILPLCWFDEEHCKDGIKHLDHYRKEWDDKLGVFKDRPRHDSASHGNDAFEQMARGFMQTSNQRSYYEPEVV